MEIVYGESNDHVTNERSKSWPQYA